MRIGFESSFGQEASTSLIKLAGSASQDPIDKIADLNSIWVCDNPNHVNNIIVASNTEVDDGKSDNKAQLCEFVSMSV